MLLHYHNMSLNLLETFLEAFEVEMFDQKEKMAKKLKICMQKKLFQNEKNNEFCFWVLDSFHLIQLV